MCCRFAPTRFALDKLIKLRLAYCKFAPERFAPERFVLYSLIPCRFAPERLIPDRFTLESCMNLKSQFDQLLFGVGFPKQILVVCCILFMFPDIELVAYTDETDIDSDKIEIIPNNTKFFLIISCICLSS
jgi:hypothetical protein